MTVKEQPQVCDSAFQSGTFNVYARVRLFFFVTLHKI